MASRPAMSSLSVHPETVKFAPAQVLMEREREIHDLIERRAYELFERHGRGHGSKLPDWVKVGAELLFPCRHGLKDLPARFILKAETPGNFTAAEIALSAEPRRLMVCGERKVEAIYGDPKGTYFRTVPQQIFRVHKLPEEVDPSRTAATLRGNILEVVMPKMTHKSKSRHSS